MVTSTARPSSELLTSIETLSLRIAEREARDPDDYPAETIAELIDAGVLTAPLARDLGGGGASLPEVTAAVETLAAASGSAALLMSMPLGLAGIYGLGPDVAPDRERASWQEQRERVAADYRAGRIYAACNSEKGAGGSLAATQTMAVRDGDGAFHLTGEKILASFGRNADVFFSTAKVDPAAMPGCGVVEFFYVPVDAPGVDVLSDWDGFGMRSTESQSVRYSGAPATGIMGFPNFVEAVQPVSYWYCLFAAIPLGCARAILTGLATPSPTSPALRLRYSEALMRYEATRAYLQETAREWRPAAGPAFGARVLRMKSYVTQEATKLSAELFALGGGRHYRRGGALARALADSFAGTALRPPLALALDQLTENFSLGDLAG